MDRPGDAPERSVVSVLPDPAVTVPTPPAAAPGAATVAPARRPTRWGRVAAVAAATAVVVAGSAFALRGTGVKSRVEYALGLRPRPAVTPPKLGLTEPKYGTVGAPRTGPVLVHLRSTDPIDPATVTPRNVVLIRTHDQRQVPADVRLADRDTVELTPHAELEARTDYNLFVTGRVTDVKGRPCKPAVSPFVTVGDPDPDLRFERIELPTAAGTAVTTLAFGPDGRLYAGTVDGRILRFDVQPDGTPGEPQTFSALQAANGGPRLLTGICFDPRSTPEHPIVYAAHSFFAFEGAPDLSGKLTRLAGPRLDEVRDLVVNLPRSVGDHATNQPVVGPDGCVYFGQPSNTAFGAPDATWGMRPERLLSGTILRLDLAKLGDRTLDVRTPDVGGSYSPDSPDAPLTIYASGLRLTYDLLWHSNGHLYAPTNGSSQGGAAPAGDGAPGIDPLSPAEDDWLFRVAPGKYHGHPNPAAGHFVLNGGNPTDDFDFAEAIAYPVGVRPDRDWNPAVYVIGQHVSANGVIEYRGPACNGKLDRRLMICRYSRGNDVLVVTLDEHGGVRGAEWGLPGLSGLDNPLDLVQHPTSGDLYLSDFGAQKLYLIRPR